MAVINILITDAGLAEVINAEQNGTAPVVLTEVGLGTGQYTPSADQTALKSEFKRLSTIAGGSIGDNAIHITANDESSDAYTVYEFGIYTASGTLFAVFSQPVAILQKAAAAHALLAMDIVVTNIDPDSVAVGDTNFQLNSATTTKQGIVELATAAEVVAGTDGFRVVTPSALTALTATTGRTGLVELATTAETQSGTDTERAVTPAGLKTELDVRESRVVHTVNSVGPDSAGNVSVVNITGNAATATKLATARKINGVAFDGTKDITVEDNTKLSLSGGTITGGIIFPCARINSADEDTYKEMWITAGQNWGEGGILTLFKSGSSTNPGGFKLEACKNGAPSASLVGTPEGSLTWPGTISTDKLDAVGIELKTATPYIDFHYGNSQKDYTARIINTSDGWMDIMIFNSDSSKGGTLTLGADSTLQWYGKNVVRSVNGETAGYDGNVSTVKATITPNFRYATGQYGSWTAPPGGTWTYWCVYYPPGGTSFTALRAGTVPGGGSITINSSGWALFALRTA